jgi:phosphoribosyl-ATP pyrophosphohydrolase/phosphoribosyl-AMP cyclohydrolase
MLAYADRDALARTLTTGEAHYYSRSRQAPWRKGETSGHVQRVVEVRLDCDGDAVLYRVDQTGPACHTGERTCFSTVLADGAGTTPGGDPGGHPLSRLAATIAQRAGERPEGSYTARLLDRGVARIAQKVGEEAVETVVAATAEDEGRLASESADLLYHLLVLLHARGVPLERVWDELERREK